ncbi:hypothetical protein CYMTET_55819 [Cymbomonas tetramitiformis]|uniref:RNA polymerase II transcription factor B subunit 2 n=1 Tax=Cymbomonas tetramitiformis TaxID=36881 RepID=A0AAE0EMZ8_9CHLO|nr:hypothetical protein CYMTET_55819 [Cymbomonas tetramitiformis]
MQNPYFSFINYLETLPPIKIDKLYESHWTCQAVFRSLPPVAKQYVLRLLYVDHGFPESTFKSWIAKKSISKHDAALASLARLRILVSSDRQTSPESTYKLHPSFQQQLRHGIAGSAPPPIAELPPAAQSSAPTAESLDKYAMNHWERLLLFLVGSSRPPTTIGISTLKSKLNVKILYQSAGLMAAEGDSSAITDQGFQFLLLDMQAQLWTLLREYITAAERDGGVEVAAVISFLLQMAFQQPRQPYSCRDLTPGHQRVVADLAQLGILYLYQNGSRVWYYPTMLAGSLSGSLAGTPVSEEGQGYLLVETNYRVYAYTNSPLQIEILNLFARPDYQLPNLYVATITMKRVRAALSSGISADQIIAFLQQQAHPHVAHRTPVVPETVADQIRLWETDMLRVKNTPAYLYESFPSPNAFATCVAFAEANGALLFQDPVKQYLAGWVARHHWSRSRASVKCGLLAQGWVARHHWSRSRASVKCGLLAQGWVARHHWSRSRASVKCGLLAMLASALCFGIKPHWQMVCILSHMEHTYITTLCAG